MKAQSYFICTTPRSGSTFLCSLLKSTQVAGYPESYFRAQDKTMWAEKWGVLDKSNQAYNFDEYLQACLKVGRTPNGTHASRIMWGTLDELILEIKSTFPKAVGTDKEILESVFGDVKFIYLVREDHVAQAVSRLRAEQTNIWHVTDTEQDKQEQSYLKYNPSQIKAFVKEAEADNKAWVKWFELYEVEPHKIIYENLVQSTQPEIIKALNFLEVAPDEFLELHSSNKRMSDDLSKEWIEKFTKEEL